MNDRQKEFVADRSDSRTVKLGGSFAAASAPPPNASAGEPSRKELVELLCQFEGEVQARDIVIATLKAEKAKQFLYQAKYGRLCLKDPLSALQRDSEACNSRADFDESSISQMYDSQLVQLERLISSQRVAHQRMRQMLTAAEKRHAKVVRDLEDERRKHAQETAQGDDVFMMLEKERERLKQEIEFEKSLQTKMEKDLKKAEVALADEKERHKQIVLYLLNDRKQLATRLMEERQQTAKLLHKLQQMAAHESPEGGSETVRDLQRQLEVYRNEGESLRAELAREKQESTSLREDLTLIRNNILAKSREVKKSALQPQTDVDPLGAPHSTMKNLPVLGAFVPGTRKDDVLAMLHSPHHDMKPTKNIPSQLGDEVAVGYQSVSNNKSYERRGSIQLVSSTTSHSSSQAVRQPQTVVAHHAPFAGGVQTFVDTSIPRVAANKTEVDNCGKPLSKNVVSPANYQQHARVMKVATVPGDGLASVQQHDQQGAATANPRSCQIPASSDASSSKLNGSSFGSGSGPMNTISRFFQSTRNSLVGTGAAPNEPQPKNSGSFSDPEHGNYILGRRQQQQNKPGKAFSQIGATDTRQVTVAAPVYEKAAASLPTTHHTQALQGSDSGVYERVSPLSANAPGSVVSSATRSSSKRISKTGNSTLNNKMHQASEIISYCASGLTSDLANASNVSGCMQTLRNATSHQPLVLDAKDDLPNDETVAQFVDDNYLRTTAVSGKVCLSQQQSFGSAPQVSPLLVTGPVPVRFLLLDSASSADYSDAKVAEVIAKTSIGSKYNECFVHSAGSLHRQPQSESSFGEKPKQKMRSITPDGKLEYFVAVPGEPDASAGVSASGTDSSKDKSTSLSSESKISVRRVANFITKKRSSSQTRSLGLKLVAGSSTFPAPTATFLKPHMACSANSGATSRTETEQTGKCSHLPVSLLSSVAAAGRVGHPESEKAKKCVVSVAAAKTQPRSTYV